MVKELIFKKLNMEFKKSEEYASVNLSQMLQCNTSLYPAKFYGILINDFGNSKKEVNPFLKLKEIAMNQSNPVEDRMRAIRYMDLIPHKNKINDTVEAVVSILNTDTIAIGERYFFFSNNEPLSKLSDHVVRDCHEKYFIIAEEHKEWPILLRLLSASFLYMTELHSQPIWHKAREFIITCAENKDESVHIRSEAADILLRLVTVEDRNIGLCVINELGDLYFKNKTSSIYTNAYNAHNESITESVMDAIRYLVLEKERKRKELQCCDVSVDENKVSGFSNVSANVTSLNNTGTILDRIIELTAKYDEDKKNKIMRSFKMIIIHPAKYEGISLCDILSLVWNKIMEQDVDVRKELEQRLLEEFCDMDQSCSSGLCSRLINILSGYIDCEKLQIKMNINDQLRANIFARIQTNLRYLPQKDQDIILNEIADDSSDKATVIEFLDYCPVKDELRDEFVSTELVSDKIFDEIYSKCINDFLGR